MLVNTLNTRTLSTLVNKNGKSIKNNLLIRSDALSKIDERDIEVLTNEFNLKRVIDLRCKDEASKKPDVFIEGVEYYLNPILPDEKVGMSKKGDLNEDFTTFIKALNESGIDSSIQFMRNIYSDIIKSDFANNAYSKFIHLLLEDVNGATLWHCSAGKDRAGFATIVILYILDFDMKDIIADFLDTNNYYKDNVLKLCKQYGSDFEEILWSVFGVREEYLDILFSTINECYGSMDQYITDILGVTKEEQQRLQNLYLGE